MLTSAFRIPAAVGVNVTVMMQLLAAPILTPHVLVCEKSPAWMPVMVISEKFKGDFPKFVTIAALGELLVPTA